MKHQADSERSKEKQRSMFPAVAFFALLVTLGTGWFSFYQIHCYEESVLEIYATQQDAYVQLVLDQINLVEDRTSLEIVNDILGTLDASDSRYWTLSQNETLVFVRDVLQTNHYKGFTTETYFVSDEARRFLNGLSVNRVSHQAILVEEKEYLASGTVFSYNGSTYRICLLTNRDTVLDNNVYLSARIYLCIAVAFVLALFLAAVFVLTLLLEQKEQMRIKKEAENRKLRIMVEKMNGKMQREELFDTRLSVFDDSVLPLLEEKLRKRELSQLTTVVLSYETPKQKERFLLESQLLLDHRVFRFQDRVGHRLILVAVCCTGQAMMTALTPLLRDGIVLEKLLTSGAEAPSDWKGQATEHGKSTVS